MLVFPLVMAPVGGLVSTPGVKPGNDTAAVAAALGLQAAPFCPKCDPSLPTIVVQPVHEWDFFRSS